MLPLEPGLLNEGLPEVEAKLSFSAEKFLSLLRQTIRLSRRHDRIFTLCCLHTDTAHFKEKIPDITDALIEEKRPSDFIGMGKEKGSIYLLLKGTDRNQAKVACDRFAKKLESVHEGRKVSYSMATFPEDGETSDKLIEKVVENLPG